jgi:signal transduction histidine kinase
VRYWFSGPPVLPAVEVPANVRHNILLACWEAVNNTLKHSGASEVRVSVRLRRQSLEIEIADNGCGFDVAKGEAKRSGLVHIRQRLEEIGGSCVFKSTPGQGTHFSFTAPMGTEMAPAPAKTT